MELYQAALCQTHRLKESFCPYGTEPLVELLKSGSEKWGTPSTVVALVRTVCYRYHRRIERILVPGTGIDVVPSLPKFSALPVLMAY